MYQANDILDALEEGVVMYVLWEAEQEGKEDIKSTVTAKLKAYGWSDGTIDYWLNYWLKLS